MTDGCDVFVIIGSCRKRWESFFIATLRRIIYLKDSENEDIAEMEYLQLDLTEEQRKVCNRLLECRDKEDCEYATHSYIAGLYDAFRIVAVLFPDKWDTDNIRELFAAKVNN